MNRSKVLLALKALLTPVAEFCVRHGLRIQDAENVLKVVMIEVARRELERTGSPTTSSRLSAATGLPRKFIPKYSASDALKMPEGDIPTRVIGQWQSDTRFQDKRDRPRALDVAGSGSEFSALVAAVSVDLNSYTVLNELIRLGHVTRSGDKVRLKSRIHLVAGLPEAMTLVAADARSLVRAAEENVSKPTPQNLHLTTRYDNIPSKALPAIRRWLLEEGSAFHRKARLFLSRYDRDVNPDSGATDSSRHAVHLSAFSFIEELDNLKSMDNGESKKP